MIDFKNVCFSYNNGAQTINNLTFHINKGEFVAIAGENGAGKSTTSKLMNGLLKPEKGTVTTAGFDTKNVKISSLAKYIGFLFQNPDRQLSSQTVGEEIKFSLNLLTGLTEEEKEERVKKMSDMLLLDTKSDPFALSRGERQKVALASVLAAEPEILILDEPTTGLDYRECTVIMDFVKKLNEEKGITVVIVCHDMEVVLDYAKRVIAMSQGRIVDDAPAKEIFRKKKIMEASSLIPPQIIALAQKLGKNFDHCSTAEEMLEIIKTLKERGEKI